MGFAQFAKDFGGAIISTAVGAAVSIPTGTWPFALVAYGVQWVVSLLYAIPKQDESVFDLTGSLTYALTSGLALGLADEHDWRAIIVTVFVWIWCLRLGTFLFKRIRAAGEDKRFKDIRGNPLLFFSVWTIQGLWVLLTLLPVLLLMAHGNRKSVHALDIVGIVVWVVGFVCEVTADTQKSRFKADERNKDEFIREGLWWYSRHPNYFGEITLWIGMFLIVVHAIDGLEYQLTAMIGPIFVTLLITLISGIPMLEKNNDKKYGDRPEYQEYKENTSILIPLPKFGKAKKSPRANEDYGAVNDS